jgi:thioredoxin-dependent peroxiredoxin
MDTREPWKNPSMLAEGTPAPEFTLPDQDGNPVSLGDLRGRWTVFWWFPKAATAG